MSQLPPQSCAAFMWCQNNTKNEFLIIFYGSSDPFIFLFIIKVLEHTLSNKGQHVFFLASVLFLQYTLKCMNTPKSKERPSEGHTNGQSRLESDSIASCKNQGFMSTVMFDRLTQYIPDTEKRI